MDSTQRSKSFKALATAQPIRKDIDSTLNKLELEKRKFLAFEREQTLLKEQADMKRKELNRLKAQIPVTQTDEKRATQTNLKFRNADRTYQITINNIQKLRDSINIHKRQVYKYKGINQNLSEDSQRLQKQIQKFLQDIDTKQMENDDLKNEIMNLREMNMKNLDEFRKSHTHLNKSNVRDQNERRKHAVSAKTFLGEEMRQSKMVHFQILSEQLRKSGIQTNEGQVDIMTDSVPLAKARVNFMIHKNKEKIKIAEEYKKFGEGLQKMFDCMREFKGRNDIDYLSREFVAKEKQIQKLGQYIGKLEYRIVQSQRVVDKKLKKDEQLKRQLVLDTENQAEKQYRELNKHATEQINKLKEQQLEFNVWLKKVGDILCPLAKDDDFSRNNATNVIGKLQEKLGINRANDKKSSSPNKQYPSINIDQEEHSHRHGDFMSYNKMKEYAEEFIKSKK